MLVEVIKMDWAHRRNTSTRRHHPIRTEKRRRQRRHFTRKEAAPQTNVYYNPSEYERIVCIRSFGVMALAYVFLVQINHFLIEKN